MEASNRYRAVSEWSGEPAVRFAGVRVTFVVRDDAFTAVKDVDLDLADGEFVAIVGPTGCGKSTLLNAAAGLLSPSAGRWRSSAASFRSSIAQAGYLFQTESLFPWKTALDNVAIGLEVAGVSTQ